MKLRFGMLCATNSEASNSAASILLEIILHFLCLSEKLVIEVDGGYHNEPQQQQEDQWRTEFLKSKGYKVIRFTNEEVDTNVKGVISRIKEQLFNNIDYE